MAAVGIALGPVIGGLLLAHFGWGSIFMVNIPVVVVALIGGHFLLPTSRDPAPGRMDPLGSLLTIAALGGLVFAVIEGPDKGWASANVLGAAAVGAARRSCAFVAWERRCDHPMLDLDLFADRRFSVGALTLTLLYFGALGTYFLYTQHLQFVLGYSALRAGVYSIPFALVLIVFSLQTPGRSSGSAPPGWPASGCRCCRWEWRCGRFRPPHRISPAALSLVVAGVGVGLTVAPSTGAIMSSLSPDQAGVGSAINDAARQVGAATGVAVLGSVWASAYRGALTRSAVGPQVPEQALRAEPQLDRVGHRPKPYPPPVGGHRPHVGRQGCVRARLQRRQCGRRPRRAGRRRLGPALHAQDTRHGGTGALRCRTRRRRRRRCRRPADLGAARGQPSLTAGGLCRVEVPGRHPFRHK